MKTQQLELFFKELVNLKSELQELQKKLVRFQFELLASSCKLELFPALEAPACDFELLMSLSVLSSLSDMTLVHGTLVLCSWAASIAFYMLSSSSFVLFYFVIQLYLVLLVPPPKCPLVIQQVVYQPGKSKTPGENMVSRKLPREPGILGKKRSIGRVGRKN